MPFIVLTLVVVACAIGGGVGGWMLSVHFGLRVGSVLGLFALALAVALAVAGGVLPGMEGVAYTLPGVLVVLPVAVGMLLGRALAGWLRP